MYIHINQHIRISIGIFSMIFVLYQPVLSLHLTYTCHIMTMANNNQFIHNTGLNKDNSLMHLLDAISPDMENEVDLVQSSKYYDDESFKIELNGINSRLCILSLNRQSINAKYEKLILFLEILYLSYAFRSHGFMKKLI